jgi:broad-specificity NMP kinase
MKPALLITGVPGSGKSTISRLLAENLGAKHIEVTKFAITEKEIIDVDDKRETLIVNLESLKEKLVRTLLNSKKLTIIDSHFSPELIPTNFIEKLIVL